MTHTVIRIEETVVKYIVLPGKYTDPFNVLALDQYTKEMILKAPATTSSPSLRATIVQEIQG